MTLTIKDLEAQRYTHIQCDCSCGSTMTPFRMMRDAGRRIDDLTIADLGRRMVCKDCGERPSRFREWRQEDAKGFVKPFTYPKFNTQK